MPGITQRRLIEERRLKTAIDVLNGAYDLWRFRADAIKRHQVPPEELQTDVSVYQFHELFDFAAKRLREKLRLWVQQWYDSLDPDALPTGDERNDRDEELIEFLRQHPKIQQEFDLIASKLGLPKPVRRQVFTRSRVEDRITSVSLRDDVRRFLISLEGWEYRDGKRLITSDGGFDIVSHLGIPGGSENLAADAEAMRLFVQIVQSSIPVRRCALAGCVHYFLNLGGKTRFCCKEHTQEAVNRRLLKRLKVGRDLSKKAKLDKAKRAIREYELERSHEFWKEWVARRANVSKNFLTRHIRLGNLKAPSQESK
jgi:hypothetical protein